MRISKLNKFTKYTFKKSKQLKDIKEIDNSFKLTEAQFEELKAAGLRIGLLIFYVGAICAVIKNNVIYFFLGFFINWFINYPLIRDIIETKDKEK